MASFFNIDFPGLRDLSANFFSALLEPNIFPSFLLLAFVKLVTESRTIFFSMSQKVLSSNQEIRQRCHRPHTTFELRSDRQEVQLRG